MEPKTIELSGNVLLHSMTVIRDKATCRKDFIFHANRINTLLCYKALEMLPYKQKTIQTPTESEFTGLEALGNICGVSIMRAGDSMVSSLSYLCPSIKIGKILIQRDEDTAEAKLFYAKLPSDIATRTCLLLDPMLATGGSAIKAVEVLISKGVQRENIIFVNLVSCPEGIAAFHKHYPEITIITGNIDKGLNDQKYILPGLGDFGCRYFGTE